MPPPPLRDSFPYSIPHQFRATWQLFWVPVPLNPARISPSPPVPPSKLMITRNGYPPVLSIEHLSFMQKLHCFEVMTDEQRGFIAFLAFLHTTCEDIVIFTIFIIQSSWCDLFCISSPLLNITSLPPGKLLSADILHARSKQISLTSIRPTHGHQLHSAKLSWRWIKRANPLSYYCNGQNSEHRL